MPTRDHMSALTFDNLPDTISELLRAAADATEDCLADPFYVLDLGCWYARKTQTQQCQVCIAGALFAVNYPLLPPGGGLVIDRSNNAPVRHYAHGPGGFLQVINASLGTKLVIVEHCRRGYLSDVPRAMLASMLDDQRAHAFNKVLLESKAVLAPAISQLRSQWWVQHATSCEKLPAILAGLRDLANVLQTLGY